mmetsp:Transcript_19617/g.62207  ORF Transcript_19617/g.62207 Transcript_19617/m.62207 type:complete len:263 (-) Transcript_19617:304-1092(-)
MATFRETTSVSACHDAISPSSATVDSHCWPLSSTLPAALQRIRPARSPLVGIPANTAEAFRHAPLMPRPVMMVPNVRTSAFWHIRCTRCRNSIASSHGAPLAHAAATTLYVTMSRSTSPSLTHRNVKRARIHPLWPTSRREQRAALCMTASCSTLLPAASCSRWRPSTQGGQQPPPRPRAAVSATAPGSTPSIRADRSRQRPRAHRERLLQASTAAPHVTALLLTPSAVMCSRTSATPSQREALPSALPQVLKRTVSKARPR